MSNKTNKIAPKGSHYMPNGMLMKNDEMVKTYSLIDYIPLIVIILFILGLSIILTHYFTPNPSFMISIWNNSWIVRFINNLMGVWFLIFALFKIIDLKEFAEGYSNYDIVAKRISSWGYIYPFLEVTLGVMYLTRFDTIITNWATVIILGVALIGITQNILRKSKIQCSCLGTILKVPLTKVTLIENAIMVGMAVFMLVVR